MFTTYRDVEKSIVRLLVESHVQFAFLTPLLPLAPRVSNMTKESVLTSTVICTSSLKLPYSAIKIRAVSSTFIAKEIIEIINVSYGKRHTKPAPQLAFCHVQANLCAYSATN